MDLAAPIRAFWAERKSAPSRPVALCDEASFLMLLSGVPALRITPGLPGPEELGAAYFITQPLCANESAAARTREHLKQVFGISDRKSLLDFCKKELSVHHQYLDFESFWENRPNFDLHELSGDGRRAFTACRDFAEPFHALLGRHGFLAWDISECMGHLRVATGCGLISPEEFTDLSRHHLESAESFRSWEEFAVSLLCGQLYWSYRQGTPTGQLPQTTELYLRLVRRLLDDECAWGGHSYYRPPHEKDFCIAAVNMRRLLRDWKGPTGCFATDQITVEGRAVGYMYREPPAPGRPDSGWRFFSGLEDREYMSDISRAGVYSLNAICNYCPDIIPLLNAPYGTAYARDNQGNFHRELLTPPPTDRKDVQP